MKRNLASYDQQNQQNVTKKRKINQDDDFKQDNFFKTLKKHKILLKKHFKEIPNEILQSIKEVKGSFIESKQKTEEEKEKISLKLKRITQNNFQLLDENCLKILFYFLPNFQQTKNSKKIIDCISFSRSCKLFYQISKDTKFQTKILNNPITLPFSIYQHILQIPETEYKDNQKLMIFSAKNKLSNIIIPTLTKFGYHINQPDSQGRSALMNCVSDNDLESIKSLVSFGSDVNLFDKEGKTCLQLATRNKNLDMVKYLVSIGAKLDNVDNNGDSCLLDASGPGDLETVKYFISNGMDPTKTNNAGKNCLLKSCDFRYLEKMQYFISIGMDPNTKNNKGLNCLMFTCLWTGDLEIVKYLISIGMDFNVTDNNGDDCLILACCREELEIVKYLISIGMDPNKKNNYGNNCLLDAIENDALEAAEYLISLPNINLDLKNNNGKTALDLAQEYYPDLADLIQTKLQNN